MPLFMDIHHSPEGAGPDDLAKAHQADLEVQDRYGVKYVNYWLDQRDGKVFCLVEAPDADAANAVHRDAHGPRALLVGSPEGVTDYIDADLRDPDTILDAAAQKLDLTQPVALIMMNILGHITDDAQAYAVVSRLLDALPSGS